MSTIATLPISFYNPYDNNGKVKSLKNAFDEKIELMKRFCPTNSLFIIDNMYQNEKSFHELIYADDSGYAFESFLSLPGKKLITSRYEIVDYPYMAVEELPNNTLLDLMDKYYPYKSNENRNIRTKLISTVHGHTLTVELLARTMNALRGIKTPEEILEILCQDISASETLPKVTFNINTKKESVFRHLCKLFSISGLPESELILLTQANMVGDSGLASSVFFKCCHMGNASIEYFNNLIEKGWINYDFNSECFSIHPLVQSVLDKEIQNRDYLKTEFLNKLLYISDSNLNESLQIAEIIQKAFKSGISLDMNAALFLLNTSERLSKTYFLPTTEDHYSYVNEISCVRKCMSIGSIAFAIIYQLPHLAKSEIANFHKLEKEWMDGSSDLINVINDSYYSNMTFENEKEKLKKLEMKLEQLEKENLVLEIRVEQRKEQLSILNEQLHQLKNEEKNINLKTLDKISTVFSFLNHPYFEKCFRYLFEKYNLTEELDLSYMYHYATQGIKAGIPQAYLLLSLCYQWGIGTNRSLEQAQKYKELYLEMKNTL